MAYSDCTGLGRSCLKRKRNPMFSHELTPGQEERDKKSTKRRHTWENLDLILALQSKELHLARKVEEAFDFASFAACDIDGHLQSVSFSRALRYVFDWTQSILMCSERKRKEEEILNPCLDHRCWAIIELCLKKFSLGASPNLFRAVTPVLKKALLLLDSNSTLDGVESIPLFENVFKCLSLLLSSNSRTFYNAGVDLWISVAADVLNIISKVSSREEQGSLVAKTLLDLSGLLLEHFATFLRFHPNPKNIFRVFVEGLLEQLFDLLVLLQLRTKEGYFEQFASMLKIVEDVMLNGLFHPAHICGFSSSITAGQDGGSKGVNESYHRHLFRKLEKVIREKKVTALGGFGCLFRLFSRRAKGQQGFSISFRGHQVLKKGSEVTGDAQEAHIPLFEVFMQFIKPLLHECKRSGENELSRTTGASQHILIDLHCMLRSLNETLKSFIQEKVYVRTEDTPEGKHYCFLKEIYDAIYSISIKVLSFWSLELFQRKSDDEVKKMLPLIAREIVVGVGYFLEIEYRVFGDDLVIIWRMLLSFMAANLSITNSMPCTLLKNELFTLGCRLINVYSELRQVSTPLFSLCKAMRFLINTSESITDECKIFSSSIQSSQLCLEAAKSLLTSQELRLTIAKAVNSVPEGQAGGCIQQLNMDVADALEWIRRSSLPMGRKSLDEEDEQANVDMVDIDVQTEILGRVLSELYATILESLSVTAMNSTSIGNSMKNLIKTLRPSLSCFLQIQSNHVNDFVFSVTGRRLLNYSGITELGNNSEVKAQSVCWIFLFFFRVYASSKSLFRQSISLMPPDLSHKASESLGDLFTSSCCMDWADTPEKMDEGYFCWITKSSISLPEVISIISKVFFSSSCAAYAPLSYMLQVMSIQRLNDLGRLIKAFEFFHEKDVLVNHVQLQDEIVRPKSIKKWKQLIAGPSKEASELTNFMMGYLSLLDSKGPVSDSDDDGKSNLVCEADWDYSLCSLDEKSLHVAVWWLFCRNSDVWCAHSTKKHLKKFFSYLFLFSFPSPNNHKGVVDREVKVSSYQSVTLYGISVEYLQDTISYEQMIQYTKVSPRFCHVLKKLLAPILLRTPSSNLDLDSSPNWMELLNILEKEPVMINAAHGLGLHYGSLFPASSSVLPGMICLEHSNWQSSFPFSFELKTCESLLNLFCNMPRFRCSTKSFSRYSNYIFNIERLLVSILLNHHDESFLYDPFEILRLFVSCRRAMKFLVMGSAEKLGVKELKSLTVFFDCPSSVLWLFKSVYKVAGIPISFFEGRDYGRVQDMIYSLVDHTSYVFFKVSEAKTDATSLFLLKDKFNRDQLPQIRDNLNDNFPRSSKTCNDWGHVELAAEALKEYAEKFLVTFRNRVDIADLDYCCRSSEWNEFSSIISCFQALLLGLAFSSDSRLKEISLEDRKISGLMPFFVSKLSSHIVVFEDLVELCLNKLIFGSRHVAEHFLNVKDDPSATGRDDETTTFYTRTDMPTSSCSLAEQNYLKSASVSTSGNGKSGNSNFRKKRSPASHIKQAINFFHIINEVDVTKFKVSYGSFLQCLLKDLSPQVAFILRQLFITSATILRIKCSPSYSMQLKYRPHSCRAILKSAGIIFATSCTILQEFFELTGRPCEFSFAWLDGVLTFLDVVGSLFSFVDPDISKDVYTHLIDLHLKAMGKCISLQGKTAILSSQDIEFDANTVDEENETSWNYPRPLEHGKYCLEVFKTKLRMSIKKYIMIQSAVYLDIAIQVIERNLSGYHLCTGMDGGVVSPAAAASIECLELILECFSGNIQFIKKSIPSLAGAVINTVLHLRNPSIFYTEKSYHGESKIDTDAGAVILMCVEVLTKVAGRRSYHMDPFHVNQCFHIPMMCFVGFHKLKASRLDCNYSDLPLNEGKYPLSGRRLNFVDHHYAVVLYTSCCRLMCSALKNQKRQAERCIPLLEESVSTMLSCLEVVDSDAAKRDGFFSWQLSEAIKCANFLRRIYEEIRCQKEALGKYAYLFLSNYISTFSGCGSAKTGIRREIDEALRPGVYSLIDICTRMDLQRLHSLLNEGPCRSTLANLLHDYQHNFQYEGKV